jgi:biotin carboxylase
MNTHPDIRVALACAYLAEVLERARQEEIRRSASSTRSERQKVERRRLTRRARVPQEAA